MRKTTIPQIVDSQRSERVHIEMENIRQQNNIIDAQTGSGFFSRLPKYIRAQIFREAGLVRECFVGFSQERTRLRCLKQSENPEWSHIPCSAKPYPKFSYYYEDSSYGIGCAHGPFPTGLLLVSRQICEEATECLYGENNFFIDCEDEVAVRTVQNLSVKALKSFTSLYISFQNWNLRSEIPISFKYGVQNSSQGSRRVHRNWNILCRVFQKSQPRHLFLDFRCSAADVNIIRTIAQGFYVLPKLAGLSVNFAPDLCTDITSRDLKVIQTILSRLSTRISGNSESSVPNFPFESLPAELQIVVLRECLDTSGNVLLEPSLKADPYSFEEPILSLKGVKIGIPTLLGDLVREKWCCGHCKRILYQCSCNHGTSWSSACKCYRPQTALFGVSKRIRKCALWIYYSANWFEMTGGPTHVASTIRRLGRERAALLRKVRITFRYGLSKVIGERFVDSWKNLFRELHESCDWPKLELEILVLRRDYENFDDSGQRFFWVEAPEIDNISNMEIFHGLVRKLQEKFGPPKVTNTFVDGDGEILWEGVTMK